MACKATLIGTLACAALASGLAVAQTTSESIPRTSSGNASAPSGVISNNPNNPTGDFTATTVPLSPSIRGDAAAQANARASADWNRVFHRLDKSSRGFLTRNELDADTSLGIDFSQADANNDGRISPIEFRNAYRAAVAGSSDTSGATNPAATMGNRNSTSR